MHLVGSNPRKQMVRQFNSQSVVLDQTGTYKLSTYLPSTCFFINKFSLDAFSNPRKMLLGDAFWMFFFTPPKIYLGDFP